jgi:3-isopropylmalate/(R)-2-methylmalate dehydratase small subunit
MTHLINKGRAWRYGDNIDTDQIYPGKYMHIHNAAEAAKHLMELVDFRFAHEVRQGDFLVVGKNFGLGSTRGGIHLAFQHLKLGGIIAESFARGFFRNCISDGMPILECPGVCAKVETGDVIQVNFRTAELRNLTKNELIEGNSLPTFIIEKILSGGSIPLLKRTLSLKDKEGKNA